MTHLNDLFPDGPRAGDAGSVVLDDHHTARRLREMIGEPRQSGAAATSDADARALADMVQAAARTAVPVGAGSGESSRSKKRPRRSVDAVTLSAASLAVVALVVAGTVGGIQMATASPAASAVESLEADEAALLNAHQSLKTAQDRLIADIDAQTAEVAPLRSALTGTSTAPDPAGGADDAPIAVTDAAALATALAAVDAYASGLAAITVPELPTDYARADIDEDSLVEVGGAIDGVQERLVAMDDATAEARAVREKFDALRPTADVAVDAYAASFVPAAAAAIARYPDAEESLRAAVTDAAARVAAADLWTVEGRSALAAYRDAFVALAADQLRFEIERDQREDMNQWQPQQQQPQQGDGTQNPPTEGSTDPGTGVTPPVPNPGGGETDPGGETPPDGEGTP
ncbi:hypothetical protein [Microbacterium oxydans]|uniref:hypothetical protein n=1 Tax=Microbacterium oxydans TaxID=82380 RepID=UPI000B84FAE2|nr:hypothetical protein [Microbacterium oxydans]